MRSDHGGTYDYSVDDDYNEQLDYELEISMR